MGVVTFLAAFRCHCSRLIVSCLLRGENGCFSTAFGIEEKIKGGGSDSRAGCWDQAGTCIERFPYWGMLQLKC